MVSEDMNVARKELSYQAVVFTTVLLLAPVLSIYSTGIPSISWFDAIIIIFGCVTVITTRKVFVDKKLIGFALFILCHFLLISFLNRGISTDVLLRTSRYFYYIFILALLLNKLFDDSLGVEIYKRVAIFASAFLWLQIVVIKIWNYYIPGFFTKLPLMRIDMLWHAKNMYDRFTLSPRPRSIFNEPQVFATFVAGYISIVLLKQKLNRRDKVLLIFLNASVIASLSSTGIVALVSIWLFYVGMICKKKNYNKVIVLCVFLMALSIAIFPYLYNSKLIFTSNRLFGRLRGYGNISIGGEDIVYFLFGHGMVELDSDELGFLPSALRIYYYFGLVGVLFAIRFFIRLYRNSIQSYKLLAFLCVVLLFGTVDFFSVMLFVNIPFITSKSNYLSEIGRICE